MIIAKFNAHSGYLLLDDRNTSVAVITCNTNDEEKDITDKVALAIKEHYVAENVKINGKITLAVGSLSQSFNADIIDEDNEEDNRIFRIEHVVLY